MASVATGSVETFFATSDPDAVAAMFALHVAFQCHKAETPRKDRGAHSDRCGRD